MNLSLFRTAEAAFAREFCHGTHGGLFGAQVRAIPLPVSPATAERQECAHPPTGAGLASLSNTPPAATAQDAQQGLAGGLSSTDLEHAE
jgi:hypothetical protein